MKKSLFIVFTFLFTLEMCFRFTGFLYNQYSKNNSHLFNSDKKTIKILTLGESTTANNFARGSNLSWPAQLEKMLVSHNYHVEIINEGVIGTTSVFILSRLDDLLEKHHPDIVISMIGINDGLEIPFYFHEKETASQVYLFLTNLRIYKLFKWFKNAFYHESYSRKLHDDYLPPDLESWVSNQKEFARINGVKKTEEYFSKKIHDQKLLAIALTRIGFYLNPKLDPQIKMPLIYEFLRRGYELYPDNYMNLFWLLRVAVNDDPKYCIEVSNKSVDFGNQLSDGILPMMAKCLSYYPQSHFMTMLNSRNLVFSEGHNDYLKYHYQKIRQKILKSDAKFIAMQYPTLNIEDLKRLIPDDQKTIYIENSTNFKSALNQHKYEDIFEDNFAGLWGHSTYLGNHLIALNVYDTIIKIIK